MAVEQFESAVGQLVGQQAAGEADFLLEQKQGHTCIAFSEEPGNEM